MGWARVIKSGLVGMIILVPMSYISFRFLNLGESVTGDLITDFPAMITALLALFGLNLPVIDILAGIVLGLALVLFFPIHWCIMFRPDDIMLIIAITVPWILTCVIASAIFAKSPREAIHTSLSIGIGYLMISSVLYLIAVLIPFGWGITIVDGFSEGLTGLPYLLAVLTAILEGCLVGTVFGAFIGSLRYKPEGAKKKKKKVKIPEETPETT
ncbi:MAG: hypothetical protein ACFFCL_12830, partial [Promethearchaeota archaeon]